MDPAWVDLPGILATRQRHLVAMLAKEASNEFLRNMQA